MMKLKEVLTLQSGTGNLEIHDADHLDEFVKLYIRASTYEEIDTKFDYLADPMLDLTYKTNDTIFGDISGDF